MLRLLVLAVLAVKINAVPVDNGVEGDPEIECGPRSITINFNTRNNFEGNVYVKGLFDQAGCKSGPTNRQVAGIELPFDTCNVRRSRSLNPKGVFVSTVVIVSFHPLFETKVDRAYRIQCFYMEADKTVDVTIQVSMLTTEFQTQNVPMPVCRYEILGLANPTGFTFAGAPAITGGAAVAGAGGRQLGGPVSYALVGQPVYHKWTCDTETIDTFCMIVHSCYVDDTNGDKVDLINDAGCANDRYLLNNPEYLTDLMAGVEAHVFKYADRSQLYFQCQITILVKEPNNECPKPACPVPGGRGAGGANPQPGPAPSAPKNPFPLAPGSPYLPGEAQIGHNAGSPQPGPQGNSRAPGTRAPATAAPRPATTRRAGVPGGRKRRSVVELPNVAGTMDVQVDMSALEVDEHNNSRLPGDVSSRVALPGFQVSKEQDGICLSTPALIGSLIGAVIVIISVIVATGCLIQRKHK